MSASAAAQPRNLPRIKRDRGAWMCAFASTHGDGWAAWADTPSQAYNFVISMILSPGPQWQGGVV